MPTYSKTELKEKLEELGVLSGIDMPENYLRDLKIHPIYEDENGEEYYDDYVLNLITEICNNSNLFKLKDNLYEQIELLKNENKILSEKINNIHNDLICVENPIKKIETEDPPDGLHNNTAIMLEFKRVVEMFLSEMREYNQRSLDAEKKLCLLEDSERRIKEEYCELSCEVKRLNSELLQKNNKIQQLEDYNKKIKNIELQLKLFQFKQKKKRFWEFWK